MVPRKTVPGHMLRHLGLATSLAFVLVTTCACGANTSPTTSGSPIADGSPWLGALTPVALPAPVNSLTALDCPVASSCWAVGSTVGGAGAPNGAAVVATTDGGAKWGSQVIPPTVGYLSGISCSDQRHCTAVGQADQASNGQGAMITTSNGGATWTQSPTVPGILDVTTVSCRPDRRCIAIGAEATGMVALVSASPSSGWVQAGMLPAGASGATDISCSDDRHCWVTAHTPTDVDHVIGAVVMTTNGGGTWATITTPTGIGYLNGVSCLAGPTDGSGALPFTSSATAPTTAPVAGTPAATAAAIAPTTTTTTSFAGGTAPRGGPVGVAGARCTVVGTTASSAGGARTGHGLILTSTNGGARWTDQSVVATSASLMDVSCPAIGSCVAVGSAVVTSAQAGVAIFTGSTDHPWSNAAVVTSAQPLSAVSCLADSRCVVVGESTSEHLVGG
jgi:hypothetical protein